MRRTKKTAKFPRRQLACCTAIPDNAVRSAVFQQQLGVLIVILSDSPLFLLHK